MANSNVGAGQLCGRSSRMDMFERNHRKGPGGTEIIGVHLFPTVTFNSCMFADYQGPAVAGHGGGVGAGRHCLALDMGVL